MAMRTGSPCDSTYADLIPAGAALLRETGEQRAGWNAPGSGEAGQDEAKPRFLLCKTCRAKITPEDARVEVRGRHVHVFCNPYGLVFEIGCFAEAQGSAAYGPPSPEFTWFPGYEWQVALCRGCGAHLGWRYVGIHGGEFHGLILAHLVGE